MRDLSASGREDFKYARDNVWNIGEKYYVRCWECDRIDEIILKAQNPLCGECFSQRQSMVAARFEQSPEWVAQLHKLGLEWVVEEGGEKEGVTTSPGVSA